MGIQFYNSILFIKSLRQRYVNLSEKFVLVRFLLSDQTFDWPPISQFVS